MAMRYFTVEEANDLIPVIEPLVGELLDRRARASNQARSLGPVLGDMTSNIGNEQASYLALEFGEIEDLAKRIQSYGCVIKSLEAGLVDFLCERDGRDVFLCWRYGESEIEYFHELHTGFQSRQRL